MKRLLLMIVVCISVLSASAHSNHPPSDPHPEFRRSYIPAVFDYVKPKMWDNFFIPDPDNSQPTGYPAPYAKYLSWTGIRCQVINVYNIGGQPYVNLQEPIHGYILQWPVSYTSPFGQVQDFLVKVL